MLTILIVLFLGLFLEDISVILSFLWDKWYGSRIFK